MDMHRYRPTHGLKPYALIFSLALITVLLSGCGGGGGGGSSSSGTDAAASRTVISGHA